MWKSLITTLTLAASVVFLVRERYRVLNALLAVTVLRKGLIRLSMGFEPLRSRMLPILFKRSV
ncbi:hypothetical protein AB1K91_14360 [Terribacillus sp. 179-K 1B1 HS]|uniref:hypothetical protein n=1 Tax=Terribacillus sp. 179-K 1B1 HS TaxID=3142388 RepID=UPI0039A0F761